MRPATAYWCYQGFLAVIGHEYGWLRLAVAVITGIVAESKGAGSLAAVIRDPGCRGGFGSNKSSGGQYACGRVLLLSAVRWLTPGAPGRLAVIGRVARRP